MYQHVVIVGNLGQDPEMRYTPSGVPVTNFPVAVSRKWKDSDGNTHEKVTWFTIAAWRGLAEVCNQYLSKGKKVLVEGEVEASAWIGQNGEAMAKLVLTATNVKFLGGGRFQEGSSSSDKESSVPHAPAPEIPEEDLPF